MELYYYKLLTISLGLCSLLGCLDRKIENLTAIVPSTVHANYMTLVSSLTILANRSTCCIESMMRTSIVAMGSRCAHSVYHVEQYYIPRKKFQVTMINFQLKRYTIVIP